MVELTIPQDTATKLKRFLRGGTCDVVFTRRKPGSVAVTDVMKGWLPVFDNVAIKSGDASLVKVSGNALDEQEDVKGVLA